MALRSSADESGRNNEAHELGDAVQQWAVCHACQSTSSSRVQVLACCKSDSNVRVSMLPYVGVAVIPHIGHACRDPKAWLSVGGACMYSDRVADAVEAFVLAANTQSNVEYLTNVWIAAMLAHDLAETVRGPALSCRRVSCIGAWLTLLRDVGRVERVPCLRWST